MVLSVCWLVCYRPINLINETKDRWVYCAAFGMLANAFIRLALGFRPVQHETSFIGAVTAGLWLPKIRL